jgi:hypothetical protein
MVAHTGFLIFSRRSLAVEDAATDVAEGEGLELPEDLAGTARAYGEDVSQAATERAVETDSDSDLEDKE